jgi:hypothetical protein
MNTQISIINKIIHVNIDSHIPSFAEDLTGIYFFLILANKFHINRINVHRCGIQIL